ncbi:DUF2207 domain-containing protein [bacterium]|nr:DUF2207 domain-containing protein [bacterium]
MRTFTRPLLMACLVLLCLLPQGSSAQSDLWERILLYEAEIHVNADSSVDVTENIRFNVRNQSIRHGILRDIPIRHGMLRPVRVPLRVKEIRLDGVPEEFEVENTNGVPSIRIGSADRYVSLGEHVYTIRYSAPRQVRRYADHDELYWNVTGNRWTFSIDKVRAIVTLPGDIAPSRIQTEAYTGVYGNKGQDYTVSNGALGQVIYESTRPLSIYEGMTIVAGFPRGDVVLDTPQSRLRWWIADNGFWACSLLLLGAAFLFYLLLWFRVGRDPHVGLILREETPLIGLSPASLRYIWKMGSDNRILSVVMLQLAQKGWLVIDEYKEGKYRIERTDVTEGELLPEERIFMDQIFSGRKREFDIDRDNYTKISAALSAIATQLEREHHHVYYERNTSYYGRGAWFCIIGFMVYWLLSASYIILPNYLVVVLTAFLLVGILILFGFLMPAYNELGRAVLDRIEGFRLAMIGGEDTLGEYVYADAVLSERYLAHAVALDVNEQWGNHFSEALKQRGESVSSPGWYRSYGGSRYMYNNYFDYGGFSNSMPDSFNSRVSHSATPPSSSSGGGGGGFSGGGGGGGGGSGW